MKEEKSIAQLIINKDRDQLSHTLKKKANAAPYSQPLQQLLHTDNEDNHLDALHQTPQDTDHAEKTKGCIVVSSVKLPNKKKKTAKSNASDNKKTSSKNPIVISDAINNPVKPTLLDSTKTSEIIATPQEQSTSPDSTPVVSSHNPSESVDTIGRSDFSEWLRNSTKDLHKKPNYAKTKKQTEKLEVPKALPADTSARPERNQKDKTKKRKTRSQSKKVKKEKASETKKKGKKRKKSSVSMIKNNIEQSIQDKEEVYSEALAELYAQQGHHKKALKMYQKLSLINPEKSSFFAPLIEKLKKKFK